MIVDKEYIKETIGGEHCKGCPHFALDIYTTEQLVQLGCKNEELCGALYGRALDKAREHYKINVKLP